MFLAIFCILIEKEKYLMLIAGGFLMVVTTMILGKCRSALKTKGANK